MPRIDLDALPDDSRIWIFGISPPLDAAACDAMLAAVDPFLEGWAAHEVPIVSGRAILEGSFLVVAVDRESETSGCSIDRMFGLLRRIEERLHVQILEPGRVFVRHADGHVDAVTRAAFRQSGDLHTKVFDTLAERLGDVRGGAWEKPAGKSWHRQLLAAG